MAFRQMLVALALSLLVATPVIAVSHPSPARSVPCVYKNGRLTFWNPGPDKFYAGGNLGDNYRYVFTLHQQISPHHSISYPIPPHFPPGNNCYYLKGQLID